MTTVTTLGFPRIGAKRELKSALENYWRGDTTADAHAHGLSRLKYALTTPGYVVQPFDQDAWLTLPVSVAWMKMIPKRWRG